MPSRLKSNIRGGYQFLPAIEPYSSGVIATAGREIIHVTLARPLPWRDGLIAARDHLAQSGLEVFCLCGVELRCPQPHPMDGFIEFNRHYHALLKEWDLLVDGENPIARTNVAPVVTPPDETVLYGFSYTTPSNIDRLTFVIAGGGELPHRELSDQHIVRFGETSEDAMMEKARCVVDIMRTRLSRLEADEQLLSAISVYSAHPIHRALSEAIIPGIAAAARVGVHWFYARPPVRNIEFEMDLRGVRSELVLELR